MKSDLSKVKLGDRIWTTKEGWCRVESIEADPVYRIKAGGFIYTIDGKYVISDTYPSAFTFNPFEQPKAFEGYWAMVSEEPITEENTGLRRFVFMEKNGIFYAWNLAVTDEQVAKETVIATWKYAQRIPDPAPIPEYTVEELTALVGHEFKIKK